MKYEIRQYGDPVLREQGRPIESVDEEVRTLSRNMLETMYSEQGIGLAAQQIGETRTICVVDVPADADVDRAGQRLNPEIVMPIILINPEITQTSDEASSREEGCLSFPEVCGSVTRPDGVTVKYLDEHGARHEMAVTGLVARAIQHEIDHLNGILFIDHMSTVKRLALKGRLRRMRDETREQLGLA